MKKEILLLLIISINWIASNAQTDVGSNVKSNGQKIPAVGIKDLQGKPVNTSSFNNNGKPMIIVFWTSVHKYPKKELEALQENYEEWKNETGVKIIVISVDDSRTAPQVPPLVSASGWDFDFYIDINSDFKRAMNVNLLPQTILINGAGEVAWQTTGFVEGNELLIYDELKKVKN